MSEFDRALRAYRRARSRHKRREQRYTLHGRKARLNVSEEEDRMLRQAHRLAERLNDRVGELMDELEEGPGLVLQPPVFDVRERR